MKFFKKFILIITVIAVFASSVCISSFAAKYPSDAPVSETAPLHGWKRDLNYSVTTVQFSDFNFNIFNISGFQTILNEIQNRYFSGGVFPYTKYFMVDNIPALGTEYRFYVTGAFEFNAAHEPMTAYNGRISVSRDATMFWNDGSKVDFKSLSALQHYLTANGFACTVQSLPYIVINGADDYSATVAWFLTFEGDFSGGWEIGDSGTRDYYILCDYEGHPIYSYHTPANYVDPESSPSTDRPHYTVPDTTPTDPDVDVPSYDVDEGPTSDQPLIYYDDDGDIWYWDLRTLTYVPITSVNYDASQYLYYFDMRDQSSDDDTTINYTVNITYNIDYTQVTYIGSSEEYESETYKYYYELPDGRSSADMTAEDLEQLNLSYDVVNYGKSADDGRLRSLYHLDGNTEDSSYWVNDTSFTWNLNPSIEYLEATNFEGCLYLDEQDHKFTLKLPSNLSASDFSLMFRYYHYGYDIDSGDTLSSAEDLVITATSSTVQNAYSTLFTNTASTLTTNSTTPIGQWCEVAVIRDGAMLYTYVNGLVISSTPFVDVLYDQLVFDFKDVPVRRQIDEIRVFNYALYEAGEGYTPITVPMDTNLVLILPDEATPLPDAYWDFNTDGNLVVNYDYTSGFSPSPDLYSYTYNVVDGARRPMVSGWSNNSGLWNLSGVSPSSVTNFSYVSDYAFFSSSIQSSFISISPRPDYISAYPFTNNPKIEFTAGSNGYVMWPYMVISYAYRTNQNKPTLASFEGCKPGSTYSFQFLDTSANSYSGTFTIPTISSMSAYANGESFLIESFSFDWGKVDVRYICQYGQPYFVYLMLIPDRQIDLVYSEVVAGDTPNDQSDAYKTVIYNEEDIEPNTIAIRSTVPVRSWRIGGVRPTLPYKGDVWMMIQDSRITSCQIFNGYMWLEVDCRIWTGERWAWPNYFNILTQQDMTDIVGTTDNVYIQDTDGYYSWITEQWKELLDLLNTMSGQLEQIDGGGDVNLDIDFDFDGTISVEFNTSIENGRNSMFEILQFFWDGTFSPALDGLSGDLESLGIILNPSGGSITVGGETVESPMGLIGKEYDWTV